MNRREPPPLATWMLEHLTAGDCNDALAGDLLEEFRSGRTTAWYWGQVLNAIGLGWLSELVNRRAMLLFAALWSMLAPGWVLLVAHFSLRLDLSARIMSLEFPWSTICDLSLMLAANLLFIWAGILAYLIPHLWLRRSLRVKPLSHGMLASIPVLLAVWVALIVLPKQFLYTSAGIRPSLAPVPAYAITGLNPTEVRHITPAQTWDVLYGDKPAVAINNPRTAIVDMRKSALLVRLPFMICILSALWGSTSRFRKRSAETST
ncbi:MAG TPA: hypothetical protein VMW15_02050 [Terracidiphilus sp.]|nr:hypothetical protein [Terracidiphilus sp.]